MIALRLMVVVLGALMLQLTLFTEVRIAGVAPELLALLAVLAGLFGGAHRGSMIAFGIGLSWDLYTTAPLGLAAVSFALVAYALGAFTEGLYRDSPAQTVAMAALGTAAAISVYAVLGLLLGQHNMSTNLLRVIVVASAMNALLSLAAAPAMRWAVASRANSWHRLAQRLSASQRRSR